MAGPGPGATSTEIRLGGTDVISSQTPTDGATQADLTGLNRVLTLAQNKAPTSGAQIDQVSVGPGAQFFGVRTYDGKISIWSQTSGAVVNQLSGTTSFALAPRGTSYAVASPDGLRVYATDRGAQPTVTITGTMTQVRFSPDGGVVAASEATSGASSVRVVLDQLAAGKVIRSPLVPLSKLGGGYRFPLPGQVAVAAGGQRVVGTLFGDSDSGYFVWKLGASTVDVVVCGCNPFSATIDPTATYVAFGSLGRRISVWDVTRGAEIAHLSPPASAPAAVPDRDPSVMAFIADGTRLLAGSTRVYAWTMPNGVAPVQIQGVQTDHTIHGLYPYTDHEMVMWTGLDESQGVGGALTAIHY